MPGDGAATNNRFANLTLSVDVRFGAVQQTFGFFTRIPSTEDNGHLVLVRCEPGATPSADTFLFYGAGSDPGSNLVSTNLLLDESANVLTPGPWYTFRLTVNNTGVGGATFTLDIFDRATGSLLVSKTAAAVSGALTAPGEIALRFYSSFGGAGQAIDVDNLSVTENVPALLTGGTWTNAAAINGANARFTFNAQPDIDGATQITRDTAVVWGGELFTIFRGMPGAGPQLLSSFARPAASGRKD